ncbi:hypothetical protein V7139_18005 [Neobacillus drentensis]
MTPVDWSEAPGAKINRPLAGTKSEYVLDKKIAEKNTILDKQQVK